MDQGQELIQPRPCFGFCMAPPISGRRLGQQRTAAVFQETRINIDFYWPWTGWTAFCLYCLHASWEDPRGAGDRRADSSSIWLPGSRSQRVRTRHSPRTRHMCRLTQNLRRHMLRMRSIRRHLRRPDIYRQRLRNQVRNKLRICRRSTSHRSLSCHGTRIRARGRGCAARSS